MQTLNQKGNNMKNIIIIAMVIFTASCSTVSTKQLDPRITAIQKEYSNPKTYTDTYDCSNKSADILEELHRIGIEAEIHVVGAFMSLHAWVYIVETGHVIDSTSMTNYPAWLDYKGQIMRPAYKCKITYEDLQVLLYDPKKAKSWKPKRKIKPWILKIIRNVKEYKGVVK